MFEPPLSLSAWSNLVVIVSHVTASLGIMIKCAWLCCHFIASLGILIKLGCQCAVMSLRAVALRIKLRSGRALNSSRHVAAAALASDSWMDGLRDAEVTVLRI